MGLGGDEEGAVACESLRDAHGDWRSLPQRLKPLSLILSSGTAEAVPLPSVAHENFSTAAELVPEAAQEAGSFEGKKTEVARDGERFLKWQGVVAIPVAETFQDFGVVARVPMAACFLCVEDGEGLIQFGLCSRLLLPIADTSVVGHPADKVWNDHVRYAAGEALVLHDVEVAGSGVGFALVFVWVDHLLAVTIIDEV